MSRSTQLETPQARFFANSQLTDSQHRKLSTLRNKRFSQGRSLATVLHRESPFTRTRDIQNLHNLRDSPHHPPIAPPLRKKTDIVFSPYRTLENSQRRLHHKLRQPSEQQRSLRKIRTRSLQTKMNFRLRPYITNHARKTINELKPPQMNSEASAVYEKLFRRRKYGISRQDSKEHVASHGNVSHKKQMMESEEDEISRNYIQNQIFRFQNQELEFGYEELTPKGEVRKKTEQEVKESKEELMKDSKSTDKKKAFRKNKYQKADFDTIEYEGMRSKQQTPQQSEPIMIRQAVIIDNNPDKHTIESES